MADPFDVSLNPQPYAEPLDMTTFRTPPFVSQPPVTPGRPQPQQGGMDKKQLLKLAIMLPLAQKAGPGAVQGLLQGFAQQAQQAQQLQRQGAIDQRTQEQHDWQRQYQQGQLTNQQQTQQRQFLSDFTKGLDGLDDPAAIEAYRNLYTAQGQRLGLDTAPLTAYAQQYAEPTRLQRRAAEKYVAKLKSEYGTNWMETAQQFTHKLPGSEQPVTFDQLMTQAGMQRDPSAPKPVAQDKRGFTPKDVTVNGKRMLANYDPDSGQYYAVGDPSTPLTGDIQEYNKPAASAGGGEKPLTPNQRANIIQSRRSQWQRFTKSVMDRQTAVTKVDSGIEALRRGNRVAATQIIITAFNKLQDETSVVREGEYARSEQLVPLIGRIEGAIQRITLGGASMRDSDLIALANEAKATARALEGLTNEAARNLRQGIEEELADYAIPSSRVFGGSSVGAAGSAPAASGTGPVRVQPPARSGGAGPVASPGANPFRR